MMSDISLTKQATKSSSAPAPQGDGAPDVTTEMIDAGAAEIAAWLEGEGWDYRKVIMQVYRAMHLQRPKETPQ